MIAMIDKYQWYIKYIPECSMLTPNLYNCDYYADLLRCEIEVY